MVKNIDSFKTPHPGETWIAEGLFVTEILNHPDLPEASLARCRLPAGRTTQLHSLSVDETYIIETGQGLMEKEGRRFEVGPGDNIFIPRHVPQCIANTGKTDLVFSCLCLPRFAPDCYTALEPTNETAS